MSRLDCSFLGRPLEKFGRIFTSIKTNEEFQSFYLDLGFAAYVSYLHMEVTHTNPVMLGKFRTIKQLHFCFVSFLLFIV